MSQFYDITKAAEVLGLKPADVQLLREQNKLRGFRDGASWKFKVDDVQNYLAESIKAKRAAAAEEEEVLGGSDLELGTESSDLQLGAGSSDLQLGAGGSDLQLGEGGSDLEIGAGGSDLELGPGSSDLELGGSDLELTEPDFDITGGSDINLGGEKKGPSGSDLELDLALDHDVSLGESDIALASEEKAEDGSDVEVGADVLDDEDLVLGGSGAGSDITIGGDSGIKLVDPADSGLSLEEPLDLTTEGDESLELGEDDMLTLEDAGTEAADVQTENEFMLTPLEEVGDEESGSQVIALDTEDEAAIAVAAPAAMLDEDLGAAPIGFQAVEAAPMDMAAMSAVAAAAVPLPSGGAPVLQEAPYSGLVVWLGLFPCVLLLTLAGMMSFDLVRNMWSWGGTMTINSTLLDALKGLF